MNDLQFKCPKCGHKTLADRHEEATILQKISCLGFSQSDSDVNTWQRIYGNEHIRDAKHQKWCCFYVGCDFVLPVRNQAELMEWLHFHKMLTWSAHDEDRWPFARLKLINTGEISRKLLVALYGPTYVPPDEATLTAELIAKQAAKSAAS